ncbi:hypothetical protein E2P81_ATG09987 [Venturia nashicola]|uniref:Uncharacterized protein n=1 Tax=Venturia nashicola TaxID=86259 RepID=A0A4Z1NYX6_9PEZI|nr:hypothetical protein E6O75_ATG10208 [Venturia nashicola]TLD14806.1 hypothetical protein E2P81_ATG09987 [Venturia nashicola]
MSTTNKTATLPSLPQELRQNVLAIAFDDAASKDIKLNQGLRKLTWDMKKEARELVKMVHHPRYIDKEPFFHQSYIPAIHKLAYALSLAFPALEEDIKFMLEKCLDKFEEENNEVFNKDELESRRQPIGPIANCFPYPRPAPHSWLPLALQLRRVVVR